MKKECTVNCISIYEQRVDLLIMLINLQRYNGTKMELKAEELKQTKNSRLKVEGRHEQSSGRVVSANRPGPSANRPGPDASREKESAV